MTHEFKKIISSFQKAKQNGIQAVMATVVDIEGSSYRRPGVGMLILENGQLIGAVSGGCVEKEVLRQSQSVFTTGTAKIMTYNGRYRLGCEGILYILIEPFSISNQEIRIIQENLTSRSSFEMISYYSKKENDSGDMGSIVFFGKNEQLQFSNKFDSGILEKDTCLEYFKREMHPCFRLIIIGSEHDAVQLSIIAAATGWEVEVVNTPKNPKTTLDFPGADKVLNQSPENLLLEKIDQQTAIVLMTHNFAQDLLYLLAIRDTNPIYIGLLGPSRRREKLLSSFIEYFPDITNEFLEIIHGPAGLNLGAETPEEIAISIISEILSVVRHQKPIPLQEKEGGIHGDNYRKMIHSVAKN